MKDQDPRIAELYALAESEGFRLPMDVSLILFLEDKGHVVDLHTGAVTHATVGLPTPSGKAIAHLLHDAVGPVSL